MLTERGSETGADGSAKLTAELDLDNGEGTVGLLRFVVLAERLPPERI